jgi:ubiquinone/menaquinone biosynthesis C-methylase UbiE
MTDTTKRAVQSQFGSQASWYTVSRVHQASFGLDALVQMAAPSSHDLALDVATGTGFTALALAPSCRRVVALDFTPGMLREAESLRRARAIENLTLCLGDAEAVPFLAGTFDIVVCRHAAHHFPNLLRALGEMARVTRPGGRVVLCDTCAPEDPELAALMNGWEARRDRSHARNYPPSRIEAIFAESGLRIDDLAMGQVPLEFDDWVRRAGVAVDETAALRRDFLAASPDAKAAFHIRRDGTEIRFTWDEIVILGTKS